MKTRTGGVWQEIDSVASDLDELSQNVWLEIDKIIIHMQALDKRMAELEKPQPETKSVAKRKAVTKKSKS